MYIQHLKCSVWLLHFCYIQKMGCVTADETQVCVNLYWKRLSLWGTYFNLIQMITWQAVSALRKERTEYHP